MNRQAPVIDRPAISFIDNNLGPDKVSMYISGTEGARDVAKLKELGITTVVNCALNLDINYADTITHAAEQGKVAAGSGPVKTYKVGLIDGPGNPTDMLLGAYFILESALDQTLPERASYPNRDRGNILVHCRGGRSRSVALVALFLHLQKPEQYPTLADAIAHVRETRELHPDEWFETPKQPLIDAAEHAVRALRVLRQA
ncbi:dual specificity protein phosphatase family protein [Oceanibium sediminis]|uniref:dual specificity protein phosphatase family protein n=1 Tax=Oceanibium sediminis TaxID=2026339 RepID=UPI000DD4E938|nr:dual specificity protein phosphatase family protein [Oceanibium sediminis]